ncbi:hypothetical protein YC2023_090491 [Brassica napus]
MQRLWICSCFLFFWFGGSRQHRNDGDALMLQLVGGVGLENQRTRSLQKHRAAAKHVSRENTEEDITSSLNDNLWNDLTEFYACDHHEVSSHDGAMLRAREVNRKPGLLHVHGAYGEMLDKRWPSELRPSPMAYSIFYSKIE